MSSRSCRIIASGPIPRLFIVLALVIQAFAMVSSALSQSGPAAVQPQATDMRIGVHPGKTRVVIDLTGEIVFDHFMLADPYRIVLDLPALDFRLGRRPVGAGGVKAIRYGRFRRNTSRIVLDLAEPLAVTHTFQLPPRKSRGHRLIVDLQRVSHKDFIAASEKSVRRLEAAQAARRSGRETASAPTQQPRDRRKRVIIDPGHGGADPGATGASGSHEKAITLNASRALKRILEQSGRYEVFMTRNRDVYIPLRQRVAMARARKADLFISVHADSNSKKQLRGASIYTLSEHASDKEAARLAEQENRADIIAGVDLSTETPEVTDILIDLAQRDTKNASARFAEFLAESLRELVRTREPAHRFAGFAVLKAPDIPSALIEIGYLSNPKEERLLMTRAYHETIGSAILRGIDQYFRTVAVAKR